MAKWYSTDPRLAITRRATIVILRPAPNGGGRFKSGMGFVDAKEGWSIFTDFEDHLLIDADDKWDPDWLWTNVPDP